MAYSETLQMGRNWRAAQEDIMRDKRSVSECLALCYAPKSDTSLYIDRGNRLSTLLPAEEKPPVLFKESVSEILSAIISNQEINGVNIADKIQEPAFRFVTATDPDLGAALSEAFAVLLAKSRSISGKKGAATAVVTRNQKADTYAAKMFAIIEEMKAEAGVSTYQATINLLNSKHVKTASGGTTWHLGTLQNLQKRWRELGLIPPKP